MKIQIELTQNKLFNYYGMCNLQATIMKAGKYKAEGDIVLHSGSSTNLLLQKQGGNNHCSFRYHLGISSKTETQPNIPRKEPHTFVVEACEGRWGGVILRWELTYFRREDSDPGRPLLD